MNKSDLISKISKFNTGLYQKDAKQIINVFSQLGLKIHLHSMKNKISRNTQIYIVDTYGETKAFFKVCKVVFLGKSLVAQGGQNPLEPARYNCSIVHGPKVSNFFEIYNLLGKNKIAFKINKIGEKVLKKTLIELKKLI